MAKTPRRNRQREARIEQQIIVDAYTAEERAMGWYYYLEEKLDFPFAARCTKARATSPWRIGDVVTVLGLAAEEDCMAEIVVKTRCHDRKLAVLLAQLSPENADPETREAIDDWLYWIAMGYQF